MRASRAVGTPCKLWSAAEVEFLTDNWEEMTDEEIGDELNRPWHGVQQKRQLLGLRRAVGRKTGVAKGVTLKGCPVPDRPKGITATQRLYARAYPDCPEAVAIRGMLMEEDQRR